MQKEPFQRIFSVERVPFYNFLICVCVSSAKVQMNSR